MRREKNINKATSMGVFEDLENTQKAVDELIGNNEDLEKQKKKEKRRKNAYKVGLIIAIIIIIILLLKSCGAEKHLTVDNKVPDLETAGLVEQEIDTEGYVVPRIYLPEQDGRRG